MYLMDGKRGRSTFHPLTSMKSTPIDMLVKTQKKERRRDLQLGKYYFLGTSKIANLVLRKRDW